MTEKTYNDWIQSVSNERRKELPEIIKKADEVRRRANLTVRERFWEDIENELKKPKNKHYSEDIYFICLRDYNRRKWLYEHLREDKFIYEFSGRSDLFEKENLTPLDYLETLKEFQRALARLYDQQPVGPREEQDSWSQTSHKIREYIKDPKIDWLMQRPTGEQLKPPAPWHPKPKKEYSGSSGFWHGDSHYSDIDDYNSTNDTDYYDHYDLTG